MNPANSNPNCKSTRRAAALLTMLALIGAAATAVAAPALALNHDSYLAGEDIVVDFSGGPGNKLDWVGLYPVDVTPGSVGSTRWNYVNDSQTPTQGLVEGTIHFPGGLALAGDWKAVFLLNDGYDILTQVQFTVVDPGTPVVRLNKRTYAPKEAIAVDFKNGPGNPKDWIGIYPAGVVPDGDPVSTIWSYLDGAGTTGVTDGTVNFPNGLNAAGDYVAFLLLNDGYDIAASEPFTVAEPVAATPHVVSISPTDGETGVPPSLDFVAKIANGTTHVAPGSVKLEVDDALVTHQFSEQNNVVTVSYHSDTLLAALSSHHYKLTFSDDAGTPNTFAAAAAFTIGDYKNILLPGPIPGTFENFDSVPEGELPAGWTQKGYSSPLNPDVDFGDLGSAAYQTWTVVNADRFAGSFKTYGNPDSNSTDYQRVLTPNPANVVNGQVITGPLATGRFLFSNSGYQNGAASQVMFAFTPDYNLTGKTDVYVSFHSLWEQNQDSIGACEYSIDGGLNWLPIFYLLDGPDIVKDDQGNVDAEATFNTDYGDVAHYTDDNGDDQGGHYGAFIGAPVTADLAPFIQARLNDNPSESKRVELYRLPQADNQAKVRLRFAQAGTDSWYWGIDDFGLYSIPTVAPTPPTLTIAWSGNNLVVSWPADATGWTLIGTDRIVGGTWLAVPNVAGNSVTLAPTSDQFYVRLQHP